MHRKIPALILFAVLLVACNVTSQPPSTSATPDVNALVTQALSTLSITQTPSPALTLSPTIAATQPPKIYFDGDTNCRTGPGVKFSLVTIIKAGQTADVVGQSATSVSTVNVSYWVVMNPNGSGACWVVRDFATPQGNLEKLATVVAPATYTPAPIPEDPILADWTFSCEYASDNGQTTSVVTVELKWKDVSDYELGYDIYRNDELLASLPPNSTSYTDVAYLASGQGMTYSIEAWNNDGAARSKDAKAQCQ